MKKLVLLPILLFLLSIVGCATFSPGEFYDSWTDAHNIDGVLLLQEGAEPTIRSSSDITNDFYEIRSNHYICIGDTSWNGPEADYSELMYAIKQQCLQNGATLAVYNKSYTDTRSGISSYRGNVYSYNIRRYDYSVYYFVRFTYILKLGISFQDLTNETRQRVGRNTGVFVNIVYKDTSAYAANIVMGDVIIKINDTSINNSDDLYNFLGNANDGDLVKIDILRNGDIRTIELNLD
ncbi:MAG: PDZ domain-containing protein [Spirochaetaceae bacterium]|jgi:hypothetical protein|nr:PDZ domain-containing protein [Spirochaetaceae bacterium]